MTKKDMNTHLSHVEEVGKIILDYFKKMPHSVRRTIANDIVGTCRPIKYMYAYTGLPLPLQAYVWGILSYKSATQLIDMKLTMECEDYDKISQSSDSHIEQFRQALVHDNATRLNPSLFQSDARVLLSEMEVEPEIINQISMTYPQFFTRLASDSKYDSDALWEMFCRFENGRLSLLGKLNRAISLYIDGELQLTESNKNFLENTQPIKETGIDEILAQLEITKDLLDWVHSRGIETESQFKFSYYWKYTVHAITSYLINEMIVSARHSKYSDIRIKGQELGTAFSDFFAKGCHKRLEAYRELLLMYARETLIDSAKNEVEETYLLNRFDAIIGKSISRKERTSTQKRIETETNHIIQKVIHLMQLVEEERAVSESTEQVSDVTELEVAIEEMSVLKEKYLSEDERYDVNKSKSVFSYMSDSELLYIMGVFNQDEYNACQEYQVTEDTETQETIIYEQPIVDIFTEMLNSDTKKPLLPLTKEVVETMEQIRQASFLYRAMYVDNAESRIDLVNGSIFENDYEAGPTSLRQEGLFLEDMILLNQHLGGTVAHQLLQELVVSYWNESVARLVQMKLPESRPEIGEQVKDNLVFFDTDVSTLKECQDSFKQRRTVYPYLLALMRHDVLKRMENDYGNRNAVYTKVESYIKPFEKKLRITKSTQESIFVKLQNDVQNGRLD